ncbi:cell division protein FtsQ/DivIB [Nocardioides gilvus]|uniref:cell division protein FtsQ/DivIB n=1 Tax=Nocardioides gilvus TaxID=1735589 RepID=UPI001EF55387|nr:FtsQ-type POTRA domain-containing protein [Nocardioides gilvus]
MRQRFARRQRARRWGVWRPVLALVVLVAAGGAAVWVVWFSSLLAVESVAVDGIDHLTPDQVRSVAGVQDGTPLAEIDLAGVERRVEALAPVLEVRAERDWPHTLKVEVTEREAVAVAEIGGETRGMDRSGVVFRDYPQPPKDLPRVRVGSNVDRDALEEAATVLSAMPADLAAKVRRVNVESIDRITLVLRGGRTVLWGSGESSQDKAAVLAALLKAQTAKSYDVSVPGQPVVSG